MKKTLHLRNTYKDDVTLCGKKHTQDVLAGPLMHLSVYCKDSTKRLCPKCFTPLIILSAVDL